MTSSLISFSVHDWRHSGATICIRCCIIICCSLLLLLFPLGMLLFSPNFAHVASMFCGCFVYQVYRNIAIYAKYGDHSSFGLHRASWRSRFSRVCSDRSMGRKWFPIFSGLPLKNTSTSWCVLVALRRWKLLRARRQLLPICSTRTKRLMRVAPKDLNMRIKSPAKS